MEEFKNLSIEISLLSEPKEIIYKNIDDLKSKISLGVDGVVLKKGSKSATFLPQVWDQLPTFEIFFAHLCQKAQLDINCLKDNPTIMVYQVQKVK
jgi:AMMECR1 domain-containing protein